MATLVKLIVTELKHLLMDLVMVIIHHLLHHLQVDAIKDVHILVYF